MGHLSYLAVAPSYRCILLHSLGMVLVFPDISCQKEASSSAFVADEDRRDRQCQYLGLFLSVPRLPGNRMGRMATADSTPDPQSVPLNPFPGLTSVPSDAITRFQLRADILAA